MSQILPAYYTTTKVRRKPKAETAKPTIHDLWLMKKGLHPDQIKAKKKVDLKWKERYNETIKVDRSDYVSKGISGNCPKVEPKVYTGKNLVGIATMHKSNMVPIFKDNMQAAVDIANMRRG